MVESKRRRRRITLLQLERRIHFFWWPRIRVPGADAAPGRKKVIHSPQKTNMELERLRVERAVQLHEQKSLIEQLEAEKKRLTIAYDALLKRHVEHPEEWRRQYRINTSANG